MTTTNGSHDLAADLLADLSRPMPVAEPVQRPIRLAADAAPPAAAQRQALEGALRVSPREWRRPALNLTRRRATLRVGPMFAELRLGVS